MLRLRYGGRVPPGGANLAYVVVNPPLPGSHLTLSDFSVDIPENIADNYGADVDLINQPSGDPPISDPIETADTDELVISPRSVLSRNVTKPAKLFYKVDLGLGLFFIKDEEASALDLPGARNIIRKHLTILDGQNNPTTDLVWDLEVTGAGPVANSFSVTIYVDRVGTRGQTFKVRYNAINAGGLTFPNFREVLNPTPILVQGTDYTLTESASGVTVSGLAPSNQAPAIGLFSDSGSPGSVTVTATDIDFGGGDMVGLLVGGFYRPVKDVVADINALAVPYTAMQLSESGRAELRPGVGISIATTGTVLRHDHLAHVRYTDLFRVQPKLPLITTPFEPWYPRINKGSFRRTSSAPGSPHRYKLRDFDYQTFDSVNGAPYKSSALEEPKFIDAQRVQVLHAPIKSASDVTIFVDGVADATLLDQVDLANGILFLTRTIESNHSLLVSYIYEERFHVYQAVNLNPTLKHGPELLGRYVALYMIPHENFGTGDTFERTIFHMIRDTATEILAEIPTLKLDNGTSAEAQLLGIYHVKQTEIPDDIDIIDTRTPGGGLRSDLIARDVLQEEAEFYSDIGGHYDGTPFPDAGSLVVEVPGAAVGTGQVEDIETLYESAQTTGIINPSGWVNPTGLLTEDEIRDRLPKYADAGAFVIEDFYE